MAFRNYSHWHCSKSIKYKSYVGSKLHLALRNDHQAVICSKLLKVSSMAVFETSQTAQNQIGTNHSLASYKCLKISWARQCIRSMKFQTWCITRTKSCIFIQYIWTVMLGRKSLASDPRDLRLGRHGKHWTGLSVTTNSKNGLAWAKLAVCTDTLPVKTQHSRMLSVPTDGCPVRHCREFGGLHVIVLTDRVMHPVPLFV